MRNFKDLPGRTPSDKVWHYETFYVAKNRKNEGYIREITSMAYIFFLDKTSSGGVFKSEVMPNQQILAD